LGIRVKRDEIPGAGGWYFYFSGTGKLPVFGREKMRRAPIFNKKYRKNPGKSTVQALL
jgi:hypothetical protein